MLNRRQAEQLGGGVLLTGVDRPQTRWSSHPYRKSNHLKLAIPNPNQGLHQTPSSVGSN